MIINVENKSLLPICLEIIHRSFETVANEFHFTRENCPRHTSFMSLETLKNQFNSGYEFYLYSYKNNYVGFFSLNKFIENGSTILELNTLAVLPEYRHKGIGKELIACSKQYAVSHKCTKIKISIVEENIKLKRWYESLGFIHTGTKLIPDLPFTVGYMELILKAVD